ncbi:RES family NAD+ phosphorylase [Citrobacter amalonaticus]|uniref:RES family NAD+ phosphorylase n=1 Tax=Citrobacter amalonaticus TaxID=35703 RepID=UPI0015E1AA43|nr:RES family NAD+ phosphorylase [Citrobacter amalonaticus]
MKRFQGKYYASAEHYGKPTKPEEMGRYNDLSGKTGVRYFAENSLTALAESYGRMYHHANGDFAISGHALDIAHMYTLHPKSPLILVDMATLASMLHLTADQLTGVDYSLTQAITGYRQIIQGAIFRVSTMRADTISRECVLLCSNQRKGSCLKLWHPNHSVNIPSINHCLLARSWL